MAQLFFLFPLEISRGNGTIEEGNEQGTRPPRLHALIARRSPSYSVLFAARPRRVPNDDLMGQFTSCEPYKSSSGPDTRASAARGSRSRADVLVNVPRATALHFC